MGPTSVSNPNAVPVLAGLATGSSSIPNFAACFRSREQAGWDLWDNGQPVGDRFFTQAHHIAQDLDQQARQCVPAPRLAKVILRHRDPLSFLSHFAAACLAQTHIYLANPRWTDREWQAVLAQVQPDAIAADTIAEAGFTWLPAPPTAPPLPSLAEPLIMIPTGGSSGQIRFAMHRWSGLVAAVAGLQQHFACHAIPSMCVLPLYHVSGLMQFVRSFVSGGALAIQTFPSLEAGGYPPVDPRSAFLSLVPTQLQRLLTASSPAMRPWLTQLRAIFLGGGPAWPDLVTAAHAQRLPIALTYGMTETAAQVATLSPQDFWDGNRSVGRPLPHVEIAIGDDRGEPLPAGHIGTIALQTASLALGYYPQPFPAAAWFVTDDRGYFDDRGYLHIVGRNSQKIITGGENVFPSEVATALRQTQLVQDVCVVGLPDPVWGQAITAVYVPAHDRVTPTQLKQAIACDLCAFKHPKRWLAVDHLPRNPQGKVNYRAVQHLAQVAQSLQDDSP